jgi:signal transduction histidine kinase
LIAILIASYTLSRKTLKPIVESWKRQNRFVQDASHELRTPLSIIKVKQEGLLEKPESKIIDNAEDISITLEETNRLTKLIKELMELAKSDSDQLNLNKEKMDKLAFLCSALSFGIFSFMLGFNCGRSDFNHIDNTIVYETDYIKSIEIDTLYKGVKDSTYVFSIKMIE